MTRQARAQRIDTAATTLQCFYRCIIARRHCVALAQLCIDKIFDEKSKKYFYYNQRYGTSRWERPLILQLARKDIEEESPACLDSDAVIFIQAHCRGFLLRKQYSICPLRSSKIANQSKELKIPTGKRSKSQKLLDNAYEKQGKIDLSFSGLNIARLSNRVYRLESRLRFLDISRNRLRAINVKVDCLRLLEHLDASHNDISFVPDELGSLQFLKYLNLGHNCLKTYPASLYLLPLKTLYLNHNCLNEIHIESGNMALLERTKEWEIGIGSMVQLQYFDARNNKVAGIPLQIERCTSLKILDFSNNDIEDLPDRISALSKLESLRLTGNRIEDLPQSIGTRLINLVKLNLNGNKLSKLPDKLSGWKRKLKELFLDDNEFTVIPENIGYLKLNILSMKRNKIKHIHSTIEIMQSLQKLELDFNNISDLPASIGKCRNLRFVSISNNRLKSLSDINGLYKLATLNISRNQITQIENVGPFLSITEIDISHNCLEFIPQAFYKFPTLLMLNASNNKIEEINCNIKLLRNLRALNLSHNLLISLPNSISDLPNLLELIIDNNSLKSIPQLKQIKKLSVHNNCLSGLHSSIQQMNLAHVNLCNNMEKIYNDHDKSFTQMFEETRIAIQSLEECHDNTKKRKSLVMEILSSAQNLVVAFEKAKHVNSSILDHAISFDCFCPHLVYLFRGIAQMHVGLCCRKDFVNTNKEIQYSSVANMWNRRALTSFFQAEEECKCHLKNDILRNRAHCYLSMNQNSNYLSCLKNICEHTEKKELPFHPHIVTELFMQGNYVEAIYEAQLLLARHKKASETSNDERILALTEIIDCSKRNLTAIGISEKSIEASVQIHHNERAKLTDSIKWKGDHNLSIFAPVEEEHASERSSTSTKSKAVMDMAKRMLSKSEASRLELKSQIQ